ncbi:MAG: hypothetical protein PHS80_01015 [Methanothrix sp.]|nr:hypothetical protein [Methanothrix sp.]MDD4448231.1 hypothetical protein [Methanothrix sp.]
MMNTDLALIISAISVACSIISLAISTLIALRSKQVYRPVLAFNMGLLPANTKMRKILKNAAISSIIYSASIPQNSEVAFICPYIIMNDSKLPISNIKLQLQYASKYAVKNDDKIIGIINKGKEMEFQLLTTSSELRNFREVRILGSRAQVCYTIPVLRPEEPHVIYDVVKFLKDDSCINPENRDEDYGINIELAKKLRMIKKLCGFCVIDVDIYSENCSPTSKRLKLLWFDTNSAKEAIKLADDARKAFWGGKWPTPGRYYSKRSWPFKFESIVEERGEAIKPKLEKIEIFRNRFFYFEDPFGSTREIVSLYMPYWNYLELHIDPDYMLQGLRATDFTLDNFGRITRETLNEKLPKIFKR